METDFASLNLNGSKAYSDDNNEGEEKRGRGYGETSGCKPRDGIRNEWLNLSVSYSDIKDVTDNFSESLVIGKGGFGKVYQGKLGGRMVAIKMLDSTSTQGEREFFQEIEILHKMRHPNLVKLVGACFEEVARALVYEYLPNGSLEDCLKDNPEILTWEMRTRITYEICSALSYLHSKSVIHADLKPANVLLDANFKSKLSDFGLCRLLPEDMVTAKFLETSPIGTLGYIDPWFLERCILRPGSDLYSLGITVLRLLTGMSPVGLGWKIRHITDENLLRKMIDPTVENWPFALAMKMIYWSMQCCFHNEDNIGVLKGMSSCLEVMLAGIDTLHEPEQTMGYGSGGLAPPSHNKDKEVIGETNPLSSSSSFSKPEQTMGYGSGGLTSPSHKKVVGKSFLGRMRNKIRDASINVVQPLLGLRPPVDEPGKSGRLPFFFELADGLLLAQGEFTYGKLYASTSKHGTQVAVKRLKDCILVDERKFESEVNSLQRLRHPNLLSLQGYYSDPKHEGEKILVFNSAPRSGSLATFLHDARRGPAANNNVAARISWGTRMKIAIDIARGLDYLHREIISLGLDYLHKEIIIHGNLTSANILLDDKNKARISDYELSLLMTKEAFSDVTAAASALGYREHPSEWKSDTESTDVYSFGVILLEILTGKHPSEMSTSGSDFQHWLKSFPVRDGKWPLDPELLSDNGSKVDDDRVSKSFKLAMKCVDYSPRVRPKSSDLWGLLLNLP